MQRIGYDADTVRYTFSDEEGNIYTGPAHEEYGVLSLVRTGSADDVERPHAFASDSEYSAGNLHYATCTLLIELLQLRTFLLKPPDRH
jgi:hypothetical protein